MSWKNDRPTCRQLKLIKDIEAEFGEQFTGTTKGEAADYNGADIVKTEDISTDNYRFQVYYTKDAFMIRYDKAWCKWFRWRIFLGWKMQSVKTTETKRCMLALFISPFRRVTSGL